ncbi:MAG: MinD/ParA family protein [Desulfovibrionales bacterium]
MNQTPCRIISVASGKGGVGKTSINLNIAWRLAKRGSKVCLIDADLGLANVEVILNLRPEKTLDDVLFEGIPLEQAIVPTIKNLDIISGGTGVARLASLDREHRGVLLEEFRKLNGYDYLLIDNSPGIVPSVLSLCLSAKEVIVPVTPEATSITDGFALIKVLYENGLQYPPLLLVNKADRQRATAVHQWMLNASGKFLKKPILLLGNIPLDPLFQKEFEYHRPLSALFPDAPASRAAAGLVEKLIKRPYKNLLLSTAEEFWEKAIVQNRERNGHFSEDESTKNGCLSLKKCFTGLSEYLSVVEYELETDDNHDFSYLGELDSLAERINRLRKCLAKKRVESGGKTGKTGIGLVCPDISMRDLLLDLFDSDQYTIADLLASPEAADRICLVLYCMERYDSRLEQISSLVARLPSLYLAGFSAFHPLPSRINIQKVLRKPFLLQEIYDAVSELAQQCSSQRDETRSNEA